MLRMDALVLIVEARGLAGPHRQRLSRLGDELLRRLVETHERPVGIVRPVVDLEHVLHRCDVAKHASGMTKAPFCLGGITQYCFRCGFSSFF
jgi:hypothetical protein